MMISLFLLFSLILSGSWLYSLYSLVLLIFLFCGLSPVFVGEYNFVLFTDTLSLCLVVLTFFLMILILLASIKYLINLGVKDLFYFYILFFLLITLVFSFFTNSFFWFYFSFESSLIPTFLLIMGWGYQPERLQAFIYFFFYTLFASLPLLVLIISLSNYLGGSFLSFSAELSGGFSMDFVYFFLFFAFLVKLPLYVLHLWLPKAHLEAPVSGSMILAGVLLKLGGYGLYRVLILTKSFFSGLGGYLYSLSMVSMVFVGISCTRLSDMKALVAYSSVAHMGFLVCGICSYLYSSLLGGVVLMVSHGLSSSGLFYGVNVMYERLGSRSMYLVSGISQHLPSVSSLIFLLVCSNFSAPPFINLFSELQLIWGTLSYSFLMVFIFPLGSFLGVVFSMYFFSNTQHGRSVSYSGGMFPISLLEFHVLSVHVVSLVLLVPVYGFLYY